MKTLRSTVLVLVTSLILSPVAPAGAPPATPLIHGFRLLRAETVPEYEATAFFYEHDRTGAQLLYLSNPDDNKAFSITFRTLPSDSSGLPHILEHSVLCGSKKYPTKEPFLELVKGSLKTFVNASTFPDKTTYPVASRNDQDLLNLMGVYLDAVFYPKIHEDSLILKQEGWRYEVDEKTHALRYNGVVYNEMKGVFSNPDSVLERAYLHAFFPDSPYSFDSGGLPDEIPSLTQEKFAAFHRQYYHPSNSLIYFYGNGNINAHLQYLNDEYLSRFERKPPIAIPLPKPVTRSRALEVPYSLNPGDSPREKAMLALGFASSGITDPELLLGMSILNQIILETSASPLRRALLDAKIGKEVESDFDSDLPKPVFLIKVKKTEPKIKAQFEKTVFDTLRRLVRTGLDPKLVEASINRREFALREFESRRYPKGLLLNRAILQTWLHGVDPLLQLRFEPTLKQIREKSKKRFFENLIQKQLLSNPSRLTLTLIPQPGLDEKINLQTAEKLRKIKASFTPEQWTQLQATTLALKKKQQTPDRPEDLQTIPQLTLKDLKPEAEVLPREELRLGDTPLLLHALPTPKIGYLSLYFDTSALTPEEVPYLSLLSILLGRVDTRTTSYAELSTRSQADTGGLSFSPSVFHPWKDPTVLRPQFIIRGKALISKFPELTALIREIALETRFDDKNRIKELLAERKSEWEGALVSAGHRFATTRTESRILPSAAYLEALGGLSFFEFLSDWDAHFEERFPQLQTTLGALTAKIFRNPKKVVSFTGSQKDYEQVTASLTSWIENFKGGPTSSAPQVPLRNGKNEGLIIPSKVQFVAESGNFRDAGYDYSGHLLVTQNVLAKDYLWNAVRVQGGAYGAWADFSPSGNVTFSSFRDPHLLETLDHYSKAVSYLEHFDASDREMTKYIIGSVSQLDFPLTPSQKGEASDAHYFQGITQKDRQKIRDEVLSTRPKQIRRASQLLKDALRQSAISVIGGQSAIQSAASRLPEIRSIIK